MNSYTKKEQFTESAEYILNNSGLLIKENCVIFQGVLYERLTDCEHKWRFFFNCNDYDYLENDELERLFSEWDVGVEIYPTTEVMFDLHPDTPMQTMWDIRDEVAKLGEALGLEYSWGEGLAPGYQVGFNGHVKSTEPLEELLKSKGCTDFSVSSGTYSQMELFYGSVQV